jgi:hypothetical protein
VIHAPIPAVKGHPDYGAAKAGDRDAAAAVAGATISGAAVQLIAGLAQRSQPTLLPVHAAEESGVNALPLALSLELHRSLDWPVCTDVVQLNVVGHTGARGWQRLVRQPLFGGSVPVGDLILVDDFVGWVARSRISGGTR